MKVSIEENWSQAAPQDEFKAFWEIQKKLDYQTREYFKNFIESIQHEYAHEMDKPSVTPQSESNLKLKTVKRNGLGVIIHLGKIIQED